VRESDVQTKIIKWARSQPKVWVCKYQATPYSSNGVPDLLLAVGQRFLGLEVKKPGGKPTPMQLRIQAEIRSTGSRSEIVESLAQAKVIILEMLEEQNGT
jgi:hypothetical protein